MAETMGILSPAIQLSTVQYLLEYNKNSRVTTIQFLFLSIISFISVCIESVILRPVDQFILADHKRSRINDVKQVVQRCHSVLNALWLYISGAGKKQGKIKEFHQSQLSQFTLSQKSLPINCFLSFAKSRRKYFNGFLELRQETEMTHTSMAITKLMK